VDWGDYVDTEDEDEDTADASTDATEHYTAQQRAAFSACAPALKQFLR
jgi:hypothetical protein